jgi:hypothetical protein
MWACFDPPIDPEPAAVAPGGMGKPLGQPGGNFPSRETETDPSGVLTAKDRPGEVVEGEEEEDFEGDEEQPAISSNAATARARTKEVEDGLM